jgi:hypothetical protein
MIRWPAVLLLVVACAKQVQPTTPQDFALDSSDLVARVQRADAQCRTAAASLPQDIARPCLLLCLSERALEPSLQASAGAAGLDAGFVADARQQPHRGTVTLNDAGITLEVMELADGGFHCERAAPDVR